MSAHTPGPWWPSTADREPTVMAGGYFVATCHDMANAPGENNANADLIAAAPDLLAVCRALAEMAESKVTIAKTHEIAAMAMRAIAKAEGKS